ncbi:LuxR family transcriptional regulator [Microbacterium oleivorans]|uniref:helix-turn-helix transcriptional regulator n=1 Tax=Microbacterium oleivorans TaxID=273677 RepID=UPI0010A327E3|nr:LuxR C-terminal-related transcriptional regulator [Microbacterium oleivorans]THE07408.1 LuxR family transcriptional regulator [Microbacterium oleivorans]
MARAYFSGTSPSLFLWPQLALTHVEETLFDDGNPLRLVAVGPAGSDKSPLLAEIARRAPTTGDTLFVDDAHLLSDAELRDLDARLDDPDAGLVLACRPWPWRPALTSLIRRVEHSRPLLALGQVDAEDISLALQRAQRSIDPGCIAGIVEVTASVTWLVKEVLAAHGDGFCRDPSHERAIRAVGEVIALRLDTLDPDTSRVVRRASLAGDDLPASVDAVASDVAAGHAEGLLLRGGHTIPIVADAVRRTTRVSEMIDLLDSTPWVPLDADVVSALGRHHDPRLARALQTHADEAVAYDAERAIELYDAALSAGADATVIAIRKARLAWARGDIDEAAALVDGVAADATGDERDEAVRILGSSWSARGFLRASSAAYRAYGSDGDPVLRAQAAIVAFGTGDAGPLRELIRTNDIDPGGLPTTVRVAHTTMLRGLAASLSSPASGAFDDLVRASETYGDSGEAGPIPELPAVIAAIVAINIGEIDTAANLMSDALMEEHGGPWARSRLLLWSAWIAVHRQNPEEAAARLADVDASILPLSAREVLIRDAVMLAHVRRYGTTEELQAVWERVRDDVRQVEPDLYLLHPLRDFIETSAMFGDGDRVAPAVDALRGILSGLGDPPLWRIPLLWSRYQSAGLAGDTHGVSHVSRALSVAARDSRVAAAMNAAATEWSRTRVDEGDIDRVERTASRLAALGYAWEGARMAMILSERVRDRRAGTRLAAIARQIHPNAVPASAANGSSSLEEGGLLSAREREVAGLVLSGMTYAEIGETIFISPRTAEHHIARIRRRLGATSRTDLIAKLQAIVGPDEGQAPGPGVR